MPEDDPNNGEQQPQGPPEYKVFRQRRGIFSRLRKPDVPSLRDLRGEGSKPPGERDRRRFGGGIPRPGSRGKQVLKWVGIAAAGWIALSFLSFAVSAQLQAFKLSGEAKDALSGGPWMLTSAQTILVLGTDARPPDTKEPGAAPSEECFEQQAHGDSPHDGYAEVPGQSPQKINGAYAYGGAKLQIEAIENFLGIEVNHVAIVDFTG